MAPVRPEKRTTRHVAPIFATQITLIVAAVVAYVLPFLSSWWLLDYAGAYRFDPHGLGLLGDAVLLATPAPFLCVLLVWIVRRRGA